MSKSIITFGKWNKRYSFILIAIAFLLLNKFTFGYIFDGEKKYEIRFPDNGKFSNHFLIHQIDVYLFCMILSGIFYIKEKIEQRKTIDILENQNEIGYAGSYAKEINLIYREQFTNNKIKNSKYLIIFTVLLYIILEQTKIIFKKFFVHMDFWMFELHALVILNYFMFNIKNYKHQKFAIYANFINYFLKIIIVLFTLFENGDKPKAIYMKYYWSISIAVVIYFLYVFLLSYTFIRLQKLIVFEFISVNYILFVYGISGVLFCGILCFIFTFINCENEISSYIFQVIDDDNNKHYIDNFKIYLKLLINDGDALKEMVTILLGGIFYSLYKFFTFKIIESLTPYHKTFSYPIYYFFQKVILLCVKGNQIFNDNDDNISSFILKLFLELLSDFISIILYLIYLEIIELNFRGCNHNLRRKIMKRGDKEDKDLYIPNDSENYGNDSSLFRENPPEVYD